MEEQGVLNPTQSNPHVGLTQVGNLCKEKKKFSYFPKKWHT